MKNYVVLLVVFFSWVSVASADVIFNEIAWKGTQNSTNDEWIELYNNGTKSVDLTNWTIFREDKKLNITLSGNIPAKGFYLIERHYPSAAISTLPKNIYIPFGYPTSIGLRDTGEKLILSDSNMGIKQTLDFSSGWPDKKMTSSQTMQWNGSSWITTDPTPNDTNLGVSNIDLSDNFYEDNTVDETINPIPLIEEDPLAFKITTKIISPKIVVAGIPFAISSLTTTNTGKTYNFGKFIWNFGDGKQVGVKESKSFNYIYEYPGEYVLTISYFDNSFVEIPDATDRIIIKVIPSDVYISSVGTDSDPYIELENKSIYEVTLSGWIIKGGDKTFTFPEGTTLLQGKKIKLSPKITGFTFSDIKYITILNPNNEIITTYPKDNKKIVSNSLVNNPTYNNSVSANDISTDKLPLKDSQIINLNDLGASSSDAKVNISNGVYSIIGLIVIIGLGIASFLFIKKKKDVPDYVERGVSANDMTIIE